MSERLAINNPEELSAAIKRAHEKFPDDADRAATWIRENFDMHPALVLSLQWEGQRELGRTN